LRSRLSRAPKPIKTKKGIKSEINVVVTNKISNARIILDELKTDPGRYDFVEVMACPGGCIGGGGQSMPVDNSIRQRRAASLYVIDTEKKIRLAHENPPVKEAYAEYFTTEAKRKPVLHTKFYPKKRAIVLRRQRRKSDGALLNEPYK